MFVVICMQEAEYKNRRLPSHHFVLHTSMEKVPSSLSSRSRLKAQSAMEYLMTYGWAILIIAIVLGVLYYLGVFNATNLAPHAQPGSCQVYRPDGPGSLQFLSLQGTCGHSTKKPFCSGAHAGAGFKADPSRLELKKG